MEIGYEVRTLYDKVVNEGLNKINIPKGTVGTVCEIHDKWVYVEIWGDNAPANVCGVYAFNFNEIEEAHKFSNFGKK